MIAIGLMSGTSLDGLDIAVCNITHNPYKVEIIEGITLPYPPHWIQALQNAHTLSAYKLLQTEVEYSKWIAEQIHPFLDKYQVELIGLHGHTIFHNPSEGISFQLGSGAVLYAITQTKAVSNFRSTDVAISGQGAPLVPIADMLLFSEYAACLNLGGIANISFQDTHNNRIGFDIAPCNILLNKTAILLGKEYDENGDLAKQGILIPNLLTQLNQWSYYQKQHPKSLDKESLLSELWQFVMPFQNSPKDILHTLTIHIAQKISDTLAQIAVQTAHPKLLITGGGAHNKYLIDTLQAQTHWDCTLPPNRLINFKEAMIFAFLGYLRLHNQTNVLSSVTGASHNTISGALFG